MHPQRHILTRALGISTEVETDMWELQLRSGDRILLCSDGLSNELTNEQMAEVLANEPDPDAAAHQLVDLANDHGGSDNITVIVVDVLVGEEASDLVGHHADRSPRRSATRRRARVVGRQCFGVVIDEGGSRSRRCSCRPDGRVRRRHRNRNRNR